MIFLMISGVLCYNFFLNIAFVALEKKTLTLFIFVDFFYLRIEENVAAEIAIEN